MNIPQIGFGTYRLKGKTYNSVIEAIKSGYTHIDTAPFIVIKVSWVMLLKIVVFVEKIYLSPPK